MPGLLNVMEYLGTRVLNSEEMGIAVGVDPSLSMNPESWVLHVLVDMRLTSG
jgi:hypothetical protein